MFHAARRFLLPKVFAFSILIAGSGVLAQHVSKWDPNKCEEECHVEATSIYNNTPGSDATKQAAANDFFQECMEGAALCG